MRRQRERDSEDLDFLGLTDPMTFELIGSAASTMIGRARAYQKLADMLQEDLIKVLDGAELPEGLRSSIAVRLGLVNAGWQEMITGSTVIADTLADKANGQPVLVDFRSDPPSLLLQQEPAVADLEGIIKRDSPWQRLLKHFPSLRKMD